MSPAKPKFAHIHPEDSYHNLPIPDFPFPATFDPYLWVASFLKQWCADHWRPVEAVDFAGRKGFASISDCMPVAQMVVSDLALWLTCTNHPAAGEKIEKAYEALWDSVRQFEDDAVHRGDGGNQQWRSSILRKAFGLARTLLKIRSILPYTAPEPVAPDPQSEFVQHALAQQENRQAVYDAVERLGVSAKPDMVIREAKRNQAIVRNILREMESDGRYSGFTRPRPARYRSKGSRTKTER